MYRRAEETIEADADGGAPNSIVAPGQPFAPGCVIGGKYLVEHAIGEGGLGVVVKAKHLQLDQPVAIKHLKPFVASRSDVVERFLREARLSARIKNEHAVKVQDVDATESGLPYMVMEFLEGRDLEQIVSETPLPMDVAIDYVLQASEALAEAHAAGIVHCDLKPANLFLASRPGNSSIVKVLDFGISKLTSEDLAGSRRITHVDERVGTPVFMSPEQLQAAPDIDARADIWSLGIVLYELVTGRVPFDAPDLPQLCVAILTKPLVPLAVLNEEAPPELDEVIARCLQKDRAKRYQNIAELAQDLAQIWQGDSTPRATQIARVIGETGQKIAPPTPFVAITPALPQSPRESAPPAAPPPPPPAPADAAAVSAEAASSTPLPAANAGEDHVLAVFSNAAGASVDELQFLSIHEAYNYAASLGDDVVRCDLYDEFAGVRGRLRVTYVRRAETGHWVPLLT